MAQLVNDATYQGLNLLTSSNAQLITQFSDRTACDLCRRRFQPGRADRRQRPLAVHPDQRGVHRAGKLLFSQVVGDAAGTGGSPTTGITGFSQLNLAASIGSTYPGSQVEQIFSATETRISFAISQIEAVTQSLGTNVGILQARSDFTAQYVNDLTSGGDALTLADLNTEAANSQALDLRQQLGIQSLGVTNTLNQAVLQLIR